MAAECDNYSSIGRASENLIMFYHDLKGLWRWVVFSWFHASGWLHTRYPATNQTRIHTCQWVELLHKSDTRTEGWEWRREGQRGDSRACVCACASVHVCMHSQCLCLHILVACKWHGNNQNNFIDMLQIQFWSMLGEIWYQSQQQHNVPEIESSPTSHQTMWFMSHAR